jgi:ribose transport system permease protein
MTSVGLRGAVDIRKQPWALSYVAALSLWVAITLVSGKGMLGTMNAALNVAPFLILVGIGQLFIITLGNGNIDLSIPNTMAVSAFIGVNVMSASGSVPLGFAAAIGCGLIVASVNLFSILVLSIPPIVATLATGLLAATVSFTQSSNFTAAIPDSLRQFVISEVGGVSVLTVICIGFSVLAAMVLTTTRYGRSVQAIGQNLRAAQLSEVSVTSVVVRAYISSAVLAAISGVLLAAYTGVSLGMGDSYLFGSIAIVALGGSLMIGGQSNIPGVWGGALFLGLLVTLLNVLQLGAAFQDITEGAVILAVLAIAGTSRGA